MLGRIVARVPPSGAAKRIGGGGGGGDAEHSLGSSPSDDVDGTEQPGDGVGGKRGRARVCGGAGARRRGERSAERAVAFLCARGESISGVGWGARTIGLRPSVMVLARARPPLLGLMRESSGGTHTRSAYILTWACESAPHAKRANLRSSVPCDSAFGWKILGCARYAKLALAVTALATPKNAQMCESPPLAANERRRSSTPRTK